MRSKREENRFPTVAKVEATRLKKGDEERLVAKTEAARLQKEEDRRMAAAAAIRLQKEEEERIAAKGATLKRGNNTDEPPGFKSRSA